MPETYEAIIEEIEAFAEDHQQYPTIRYQRKYGMDSTDVFNEAELKTLKHLCARVREAVGGDPLSVMGITADDTAETTDCDLFEAVER